MPPNLAERIIQEYGTSLENHRPFSLSALDASNLPYPKEEIKKALIFGLRTASDSQRKEKLRVAYLLLANYQEGVGTEDQDFDLSDMDLNDDPMKLAAAISTKLEGGKDWRSIVETEHEILRQELVQMEHIK
jgi:hypothetical protein